jgi:hypothetical protein
MPRLKKKWMPQAQPEAKSVAVMPADSGCPEFPDLQTAIKCSGFTEGQLRGMIKRGEIRAAKMPYKREGKLHIFREDLKKLMEKKAAEFAKAA